MHRLQLMKPTVEAETFYTSWTGMIGPTLHAKSNMDLQYTEKMTSSIFDRLPRFL